MKFIPLTLLLISACATQGAYIPINELLRPREQSCPVSIFLPEEPIPVPYRIIGMLTLEAPKISAKCDWEKAWERYRSDACKFGAHAVQVLSIEEPLYRDSCYQIMGLFLELGPGPS